jgi:hypothetical protein
MKVMRGCLIVVAILLGAAILVVVIAQLVLNHRAEATSWAQLTSHYGTTDIRQNDRMYNGPPTYYYSYAEICYDVSVSTAAGGTVRKIAKVVGDDDGGTFSFAGEFPSMAVCEASVFHG